MTIFSIFTFAGGLGLFLFGMNVMGDAIRRQAGGRMKKVLESMTSSPVRSVLLGTGVTAVIQSSAATCIMVLGFVNSGIMTLQNSVAVMMGNNIGTCATAWLLSLNSISGDSFLLKLINPDSFVPILACIGAFVLMFTHKDGKRDLSLVMLGFAVLMFGMDFMSTALAPLTGSQEFAKLLVLFSNPFVGILIGFVITCVTQSSSASIGILQAVAATGEIRFSTALPIILGINIGAMIIVLFSSVGGNRDAKRSAFISFIYNIIGAVIVQTLYIAVDAIFDLPLSDVTMGYVSIAIAHTVYKTLIAAVLLPFSKQLIWLSKLVIPSTGDEEMFQLLDDRFLNTPSVAVAQCRELTNKMAELSRSTLNEAMDLTEAYTDQGSRDVQIQEKEVDLYEDKLGSYMVKLSARSMNMSDSREVSKLLHCIGDFERISDHAVNILGSAEEMEQKNLHFSPEAEADLKVMYTAVREIVDIAVNCFTNNDLEMARRVEPLEQAIDLLRSQLKSRHIARLQRGECTTMLGFVFSDLTTNFERVADHCSNIAVCVIQVSHDTFDTHSYLNTLKSSDDEKYETLYREYLEKYALR